MVMNSSSSYYSNFYCDYIMSGGSSSNNQNYDYNYSYNYNYDDSVLNNPHNRYNNSPETDDFPDLSMLDEWLDSDSAPQQVGPDTPLPPTALYGSPQPNEDAVDDSAASGTQVGSHATSESNERREGRERVAFKTKSEVEILDDGFKWRKYGKKMVKNSPNPRNYYRCSVEGCPVKKRVERDREDPEFVITTYEGVHNHQSSF